jgi:hypothetical protein
MRSLAELALAEDDERRFLDGLSDGERRHFFEEAARVDRDPTTYALFCVSGAFGLQHVYLRQWREALIGWAGLLLSAVAFFRSVFEGSFLLFFLSGLIAFGAMLWGWLQVFYAGRRVRAHNLEKHRAILEALRWRT